MTTIPTWYERKFEFAFPVEQYPNVDIRLRGTPAHLEELLRSGSRDRLIAKPGGKWSPQEHAGHLLDLETLWMARVEDFVRGSEPLSVADLTNRRTDEANFNAQPLDEILSNFRRARMKLVDRVEEFPPDFFGRSLLHPRLKQPMRLVDHLFFVAEHDDHHLAKIWGMLS
jgi:uncharacterized damage-inducible protein DinB